MKNSVTNGPDAPVSSKAQDDLERWWLAQEAFDLASTAPAEWSIRIGLYGAWGTGKTSVLGFIRSMCQPAGHVAVKFNPWGCHTADEMWRAFAVSVHAACESAGVEIPKERATRLRAWIAGKTKDAKEITDGVEYIGPITKLLASVASPALTFGVEDLISLRELVAPRRVLVLIDDVDRVDPSLLPGLLFSLKELLNAPGFSFILALDPSVVAPALVAHHPGWGDGLKFLEKIIDFPMNLPEPSEEALWALARRDIEAYCPFVDLSAARGVFDLFPRNPRALRQYIRHLWSLKREVERHRPDELDWTVLLLIQLMKFRWPIAARMLFANTDLLSQLTVMRFFTTRSQDPEKDAGSLVRSLLARAGVPQGEAGQAERVALALGERTGLLATEKVAYLARMTERPDAITWKEFDTFNAAAEPEDAEAIRAWVTDHAARRGTAESQVLRELFRAAKLRWHHALERAADCKTDDELTAFVAEAGRFVALLGTLAQGLGLFAGETPVLGVADFQEVLATALRWTHFTNHEAYLHQREKESELVLGVVRESSLPAVAVFEAVKAGVDFPSSLSADQEAAKRLTGAILDFVEPETCAHICDGLFQANGIAEVWTKEHYLLKNLLLDPNSSLYTDSGLRTRVGTIPAHAAADASIQANCVDLAFQLAAVLEHEVPTREYQMAREVARHQGLAKIAWEGATARRLQPRIQGSLVATKGILEQVLGHPLETPAWWTATPPTGVEGAQQQPEVNVVSDSETPVNNVTGESQLVEDPPSASED